MRIIKEEMTNAELSHLFAFLLVFITGILIWFWINRLFGVTILILNIFMNLYPTLLQQHNKRRINHILTKRNFM